MFDSKNGKNVRLLNAPIIINEEDQGKNTLKAMFCIIKGHMIKRYYLMSKNIGILFIRCKCRDSYCVCYYCT